MFTEIKFSHYIFALTAIRLELGYYPVPVVIQKEVGEIGGVKVFKSQEIKGCDTLENGNKLNRKTMGLFLDKNEAIKTIEDNKIALISKDKINYPWIVIERIIEGLFLIPFNHCYDENAIWFVYNKEINKYDRLDKIPEEIKEVVKRQYGRPDGEISYFAI